MRTILLSQDKVTLIDDNLFDYLNQYKWSATSNPKKNLWYAVRTEDGKSIMLHSLILKIPIGYEIDHKDHDGLNNQLSNLRLCTSAQNKGNRRKTDNAVTSKYKGVSWHFESNKWRATIMSNYKQTYLGLFLKEEDAALAYNTKALEYFGEFACLNVI